MGLGSLGVRRPDLLPRTNRRCVFRRVLSNGLTAERLLMARVSRGRHFAQYARDHDFLQVHRRDRLEHERRHHLVPTEIRGVVGQGSDQLLFGAEQFQAAHLSLEPSEAQEPRVSCGSVGAERSAQAVGRLPLLGAPPSATISSTPSPPPSYFMGMDWVYLARSSVLGSCSSFSASGPFN